MAGAFSGNRSNRAPRSRQHHSRERPKPPRAPPGRLASRTNQRASLGQGGQRRGPREKVFVPGRCVPLDRNAKVRVMMLARALSRRQEKGKAYELWGVPWCVFAASRLTTPSGQGRKRMQGFCESRAAWRPIAGPAHPRNRRGAHPLDRHRRFLRAALAPGASPLRRLGRERAGANLANASLA